MALLPKVDYFGLSAQGWTPASTSENRAVGYTATANGPDNFVVAIDVGGNNVAPQVDYVALSAARLSGVKLGKVYQALDKKVALGGLTVTTQAGAAPTMTVTGS